MRVAFVTASGQNLFFEEMLGSFRHELEAAGIETESAIDHFPLLQDDLVYVFVPHEYMPLTARVSHPDPRQMRRSIAICTEQPGTTWHERAAEVAALCGAAIDIHMLGARDLASRGVAARFMQLGYTPTWDRWHGDEGIDRPIDVTFMGGNTNRRSRALGSCAPILTDKRAALHLYEVVAPMTRDSATFFSGERKWEHIKSSKVMLNIHRSDTAYFEWQRVINAMANGCIMLTEHSIGFDPLVPGLHFLSTTVESMPGILRSLLDSPGWRRELRQQAYEMITEQLPMSASIDVLIQAAEDVSRAPAGYVGTPSPPIAMPVRPALRAPAYLRAAEDFSGEAAIRMALKILVSEVRGLKRELAQGKASEYAQPDQVFYSGPYAEAKPKVSVIVTLYDYEHVIAAALESVAASDFTGFEVVLVDDASTDNSLEVARETLEARCPWVPAKIVALGSNGGLPAARNLGARNARGEYLFILDADNTIYPHALERLVERLDADPGLAFAYGIIEDFSPGGSTDLRNWIEWSPERLRYGNFVDAMAMMRREALFEVGGYTDERRLYGWEDFDLWCSFADHDLKGELVPEILARYRTGSHSMISVTNIDDSQAWAALIERHPRLAEQPGAERDQPAVVA